MRPFPTLASVRRPGLVISQLTELWRPSDALQGDVPYRDRDKSRRLGFNSFILVRIGKDKVIESRIISCHFESKRRLFPESGTQALLCGACAAAFCGHVPRVPRLVASNRRSAARVVSSTPRWSFHRIQLRCIRRQILRHAMGPLREFNSLWTPSRLRCAGKWSLTIHQRADNVAKHRLSASRWRGNRRYRAGIEPKVAVAHRQYHVPTPEVVLFQLKLNASIGVSLRGAQVLATMRLLTQSAFVDEDDRASLVFGLFFNGRPPLALPVEDGLFVALAGFADRALRRSSAAPAGSSRHGPRDSARRTRLGVQTSKPRTGPQRRLEAVRFRWTLSMQDLQAFELRGAC